MRHQQYRPRLRASKQAVIYGLLVLSVLLIPDSLVFAAPTPKPASLIPSEVNYNYQVLSGAHKATGQQQLLILLVDFQDVHHTKTVQDIQNILNQLNAYYTEVSYGKISISAQVYGWYGLSRSIGFYGSDSKNPGDDDNLEKLAQDSLAHVPSSVDLSPFKFLAIVHAGQAQEDDQYNVKSEEIWSQCHCSVFPNYGEGTPVYGQGGKAFRNYLFVSEFNGFGVLAHEFGHALGLPDMYQLPASEGKHYVGYWSLMDSGNRCCSRGAESTPSYIGGWGAALLGWLTPTVADPKVLVSPFDLKPLESLDASTILVPVSLSTYYFIEYRSQTGSDSHLPKSGILIYFVNENLRTGHGPVQLVNPATSQVFTPQEYASDLNNAVFSSADRFRDSIHQVYLAFLGSGNLITTLYSTQELTSSIIQTRVNTPQISLSGMYKDRLSLTATLVDQSGVPIGGQAVAIEAFGLTSQWEQVGTTSTDPLGGISYELRLAYGVGRHFFRFFYPGAKRESAWLASSMSEFSVDIQPAKMILSMPQFAVAFDRYSVTASVTDMHGEEVSDLRVMVYVNGIRQGEMIVDEKGKGNFPLLFSFADIGPRTVTLQAEATNYSSAQTAGTVLLIPLWMISAIAALIALAGIFLWKSMGKRGRVSDSNSQ
jgi:M6 family metalloprotease-like protein